MNREQIREHWSRFLSGQGLPAESERAVMDALEQDTALREELLKEAHLDGLLRAVSESREEEEASVRSFRDFLAAERDSTSFIKDVQHRMRKPHASRWRRSAKARTDSAGGLRMIFFAAAALLVVIIIFFALSSSGPVQPPGRTVQAPPNAPVRPAAVPEEKPAPAPPAKAPPRSVSVATAPAKPKPRIERELTQEPRPAAAKTDSLKPVKPPAPLPSKPSRTAVKPPESSLPRLEGVRGRVSLITQGKTARAATGGHLAPGGRLETGRGGAATVTFRDGTRLVVNEETRIHLIILGGPNGTRIGVEMGVIRADVAPQDRARPLVFTTSLAEARVEGTLLTLAAHSDATQLEVREGRVRLTRTKDRRAVQVRKGQYVLATAAGRLTAKVIPSTPTAVLFSLINADDGSAITPIRDRAVLNLSRLPTRNLNLRVFTVPAQVGCVQFATQGNPQFNAENQPPYALHGSSPVKYTAWTAQPGDYTVTATPYSGRSADKKQGTGTPGASLTIRFRVIDGN